MDLMYTDTAGTDVGSVKKYTLDLEIGGTNDFTLSCLDDIEVGALVYIDSTEYGGIVDKLETDTQDGSATYSGRTWHGILATHYICPPAGRDYAEFSGDANAGIAYVLGLVGLDGLFTAEGLSGISVNHRFERFCSAYDGITAMLLASDARLALAFDGETVALSAVAVRDDPEEALEGDVNHFEASSGRAVNHLICLGTGELAERDVVHLYADASGRISQTQTLFGEDEIAVVYDYSNASHEELVESGTEKLMEYQGADSCNFYVGGEDYAIGDVAYAYDPKSGLLASARIEKKVVRVNQHGETVECSAGDVQGTQRISASAEGSAGGESVTAGKGLTKTGSRLDADVDSADLGAVSALANSAYTTASNASAAAGAAQSTASTAKANAATAQSTADTAKANAATAQEAAEAAQASADGKVSTVTATSPVTATRSGQSVALAHAASGVTAGSYGPAANVAPSFGETVNVGPQLSIDAKGHVTGAAGRTVKIPSTAATSSAAGLMSAADKAKLDGVASGAQVNSVTGVKGSAESSYRTGNVNLTAANVGAAAASHTHSYLPLSGGTMTGAVTNANTSGGSWITGKTGKPKILDLTTPSTMDGSRYDPIVRGLNTNGDYWNFGLGADNKVGFYGFLKDRTANGHDWYVAINIQSGVLYADKGFSGALSGNASTASKLATPRTITLNGAVSGSASFDGSENVTITTTGNSEAAGFLAAHPVGSYWWTSSAVDPSATYGGSWSKAPSMGANCWHRTA